MARKKGIVFIDRISKRPVYPTFGKYPVYLERVSLKYLASYLNIKPESLIRIRNELSKK
ncbi:hypothetical protein [Cyclobacterium sp.]|uniref:hypothetical protein n=1 Tax=Cyclobacterium sp. TaxID=1966343 RepID=UPI00199AEB76|nr:hypothetical protein [Cyclobacterium sp.]MBD3630886.1 hypothetical protein [Cyclobacterium sp.]